MPRIIALPTAPYAGQSVLAKSLELAKAFRAASAQVIAVRVERPNVDEQPPRSELDQTVAEVSDAVVIKRTIGGFYNTDLHEILQKHGVDTIVIAGIATNMGVESTARAASDHGYGLVFVEDAMSGLDADAHKFAVEYVFPKFGKVVSTEEIVRDLVQP